MSSKKINNISIRILPPVDFVQILVPVERRERKKVKPISMPPSLIKKLTAYAKRHRMSDSALVTFLCKNFLDSMEQREKAARHARDSIEAQRKP